jgi:lipoyl(octanoyl) transferase
MFWAIMVQWLSSKDPVPYEQALSEMDSRVAGMHEGSAQEAVWLLQHPSLYTAGTSAKDADLLKQDLPVFKAGRGGQYTYHGPGQRIAYVMLDLKARQKKPDVKRYVCNLEQWIINALADFGIKGERREGRIGIWVQTPEGDKKIAAIGVRVRHWITMHGIAINVDPDLSRFGGIVPCGIADAGVTSMKVLLDRDVTMEELDQALRRHWDEVFESDQSAARSTSCALT